MTVKLAKIWLRKDAFRSSKNALQPPQRTTCFSPTKHTKSKMTMWHSMLVAYVYRQNTHAALSLNLSVAKPRCSKREKNKHHSSKRTEQCKRRWLTDSLTGLQCNTSSQECAISLSSYQKISKEKLSTQVPTQSL